MKGTAIQRERIMIVACSDVAGQVRGKGFPADQIDARRQTGVGWTPTNVMINRFGRIPATPFGSSDDLMLVPAAGTDLRLDFEDGTTEQLMLGDILTTRGRYVPRGRCKCRLGLTMTVPDRSAREVECRGASELILGHVDRTVIGIGRVPGSTSSRIAPGHGSCRCGSS